MDKRRFCIFAPEGTFFQTCAHCGSPCIQDIGNPWPNCTWCTINTTYEDPPSEDETDEDELI